MNLSAWQEIVGFLIERSPPSNGHLGASPRRGRAILPTESWCNPTASLRGDGLRAAEIEFRRLFRLARVHLNGKRHASRAFQEDGFVLDPVRAKDEVGKGLVR